MKSKGADDYRRLLFYAKREGNIMGYPTLDFIFLSEEDMIKSGVKNMPDCIDVMEEVVKCLNAGDYVMGGENHGTLSIGRSNVILNHIAQLITHQRIQRRCRLIHKKHLGIPCQYTGQHQLGTITVGKGIHLLAAFEWIAIIQR